MSELDAEELLHLGLHALRNDNPPEAIAHLKNCLERDPANAKAVYLLGATYAQVGLYDRAEELLLQAIALNGDEYTAIFQLGLLHLTGGDVEQASSEWATLDSLGREHPMHRFKSAMLALAADDFAGCMALIDAGIEANLENPALNRDMLRVKAAAETALGAAPTAAAAPAAESGMSRYLLSGYQQAWDKK
jgi:Flp pilus assembly protein TadD